MRIKLSFEDKIFTIINYLCLTFVLIIVGYPLLYVLSASFTDPKAIEAGKIIILPIDFTLAGYKNVFNNKDILLGYKNSIFYTVVGTFLNIFVTLITGYALSFKDFFGKKFIMIFFLITMFFGGGLIPTYLVIKNLGLINTRWALILPTIFSLYNVFITMRFFENTIPDSLYDAAVMDGCGDIKFLFTIIIPLSKAIIAVNAVFYGVGHWNQYFAALIYINDKELYPLQIFLRQVLVLGDSNILSSNLNAEELIKLKEKAALVKYSLIIISSLPVFLIYPFVQKYFVKGVMIGSNK